MRTLGATKGGEAGEGGENKACGPPFAAFTGFRRPVPRLLRCSKEHNGPESWHGAMWGQRCGIRLGGFNGVQSTMKLYFGTSEAAATPIERYGFTDHSYFCDQPRNKWPRGVSFADGSELDDLAVVVEVVLEVWVPYGFDLRGFESKRDGPDCIYKEYLVPASIANRWLRRRYINW